MAAQILQGNVYDLLPTLKPGSVDVVVTSPPYWMLRDYSTCPCVVQGKKRPGCTNCDDNGKVPVVRDNQLGMEKTPGEFVANLVRVFRLVRDCLADHGVVFCNIGDSYGQQQGKGFNGQAKLPDQDKDLAINRKQAGIPVGNLCLIPQRLSIALQDDGWIVRSVIVWHKPSPMPASLAGWAWRRCRVKKKSQSKRYDIKAGGGNPRQATCWERVTKGIGIAQWTDCLGCPRCAPNQGYVLRRGSWRPTSAWEPLLMLAKTGRYFSDGIPVQTPAAAATVSRDGYGRDRTERNEIGALNRWGGDTREGDMTPDGGHSGANARDVQSWSAEPLGEKHYASFPTALVRWCLSCGTSAKGYCVQCGLPWCRVVEADSLTKTNHDCGNVRPHAQGKDFGDGETMSAHLTRDGFVPGHSYPTTTIGWRPSCACSPVQEPRRGLVLDPFAGSGRTGLTAARMGLDFVGLELNPVYAEMARRLLHEDAPLFAQTSTEE